MNSFKESCFVIVGGNQHLLRHSFLRQLRFIIFVIMAMNFSSFALCLLAGASTLQVLALLGLNPTASRSAEPGMGGSQGDRD